MNKQFLLVYLFLLNVYFINAQNNDSPKIYEFVELMPEYPGGVDGLREFILSDLKYPTDSCANVAGKLYVKFVVDTAGNVQMPVIIRGLCASLDSAVLDVFNGMTGWTPGKQNGKDVNVRYTMPVQVSNAESDEVVKPTNSGQQSQAKFPGGSNALSKYINDELKYPRLAKQSGITGTVQLVFKVNEDGSISNIHVGQGVGGGCDEEAVRLIEQMPKWQPAMSNGKPVSSYVSLGIVFAL